MLQPMVGVLPVIAPLLWDGASHLEWFNALLTELDGATWHFGPESTGGSVTTRIGTDPSAWPELEIAWEKPFTARAYRFVRFDVEAEIAPEEITVEGGMMSPADQLRLARRLAAESFVRVMGDIVLAANIAKPGALQTDRGSVLIGTNDVAHLQSFRPDSMALAVEDARQKGWPPIQQLSLRQTLLWLDGIQDFRGALPKGPAARAVAALTYLLTDPSELALVWGVLGLEALYAEGTNGLAAQLVGKTRALLGKPYSFQKRVSQMYEVRSRIVHGSTDIPLSYAEYTVDEDIESYRDRRSASTNVAVSLLISTVQRMLAAGGYQLEFSYSGQVAI